MAPVPPHPSLADAALDYLRRRRHLLVRLGRVERALRRLGRVGDRPPSSPDDLRRLGPPPVLHREALDSLHRMPTEELARLDGRIDAGA